MHHLDSAPCRNVSHKHFDHGIDQIHGVLPFEIVRLPVPESGGGHPVVQPVYRGLMGGWEGNWLGWNTAHDVSLPGSEEGPLGFFMYPVAENEQGRFDSYAPDSFKYQITAREI